MAQATVMGSSTKLEAGALIAGRYRAEEPVHGAGTRRGFAGTDEESGRRVVLFELSASDAESLGPALRVEHAHFAKVLDVIQMLGSSVLVVEQIGGTTLDKHVIEASDHPVEAVRMILRIADAIGALHALGGAHGCLCPEAVISEPQGRAGPLVSFAPPLIGASAYRSPSRGGAGRPSEADDAWAVGGLLHLLLTGTPPPVVGIASEAEIAPSVRDPVLRATLRHSLAANERERSADLKTLKRELARWFVDHAGDEPSHPGTITRPPPLPLPTGAPSSARSPQSTPSPLSARLPLSSPSPLSAPSATPTVASVARPSVPRSRRRIKIVIALAVGGTVLGVSVAWAVSALRKRPVQIVHAPSSASAVAAAPAARAIDLSEVPVKGEPDAATGNQMATCVAGYLPKGAFVATPKLDWICGETDPRLGAERFRTAVVSGGAGVQVTAAMKLFSRIGWYDMPAYALVRGGCCTDPKPIELPAPMEGCPDMGQAVRDIAKNVIASQSFDEPMERYEKAINCEVAANRSYLFRHVGKSQYYQGLAFRELVKAIEAP